MRIAVMTFGESNALAADLPLPSWYWGELSGMHCLDTAIAQVVARGYSHHIQRLMVLSNIATLLGVDPQALNLWFWEMYVDAYEWMVAPSVGGMATWADGGIVRSKPYVSSRSSSGWGRVYARAASSIPPRRAERRRVP